MLDAFHTLLQLREGGSVGLRLCSLRLHQIIQFGLYLLQLAALAKIERTGGAGLEAGGELGHGIVVLFILFESPHA